MLCGSPIAWPISCVITCSIASSMRRSVSGSCRASGLAAPVWTIIQFRYERMWLWYQTMSDSMISPVRGSEVLGP